MFAIGWCKCSMKNKQFGLYGSFGKIENAKDEWQNRGANLTLVGCIIGQSLQYAGDKLFEKIQTFYKSLRVPSFDQVNYEANISANQDAFKFASTLTFTINRYKNSPHLDKDASLYALGWWFQADKWSGQIQRYAKKQCTGGRLIFPNEHFWIDLSKYHGPIQVLWENSTFFHYTDPAQDNKSITVVGMSAQCSRTLAKTMWRKIHGFYEMGKGKAITSGMDPNTSHTNHYACPGSQLWTCKSLRLNRFPTIKATPLAREGSQKFQQFLMPVQAPHTSHTNLYACKVSQQFKQFLMPVQALYASHANPYAYKGFQQFRQLLTPVQDFDASHTNPYTCTGSQQFRQFIMPGQPADNSKNSIHS
ncbi:hypothetical protein O181_011517 [Austropuccinia psidii MF-1]|uniref:Tet-like 2OG-Fe(II) oxygenase domain-containing protein n=1 Tax=Austropuccinia psidii MF-1 TaxID=1389203 RepID=A0A9Q3BUM7_9BASI|nr:hypothetical protein [Austropuccinia psidii MF-1]